MKMTNEEMIDKLVKNVPNMAKISFYNYFGNPKTEINSIEGLQKFAREQLERKSDEGEYLLDIEVLYDDADDNDELRD